MKFEGYDLEEMPVVEAVRVGFTSLIGIGGERKYPLNHGNYFSLDTADGKTYEIANMWYENLQHLLDEHKILFPINIKIIDDTPFGVKDGWAIVYDDSIPRNYYTDISYRAPQKFWSLTKQANRQLDIDTGRLTVTPFIHDGNVYVAEKYSYDGPKIVSAEYVRVLVTSSEDDVFVDPKFHKAADPKFYKDIGDL